MTKSHLSYLKNLILAVFGIPCGVLVGVTGLSPAPLLQPALRFLLGLSGATLNGVVLVFVSFAAWSALVAFGQSGHVPWFSGLLLTIGTFAGAALAGKAVTRSTSVFVRLRPIWTFVLLSLSLMMIVQSFGIGGRSFPETSVLPDQGAVLPLVWSFSIGVVVGFVGLVGELGSMLTVPLLFYLLGRSIRASEGTGLYVLVLASLPTAMVHALRRALDVNAALALTIGGVLGALFGSHLAVDQLSEGVLLFLSGGALTIYSLINLFQRPIVDENDRKNSTTNRS
jgi:uncharacterized membrane protein YfcA